MVSWQGPALKCIYQKLGVDKIACCVDAGQLPPSRSPQTAALHPASSPRTHLVLRFGTHTAHAPCPQPHQEGSRARLCLWMRVRILVSRTHRVPAPPCPVLDLRLQPPTCPAFINLSYRGAMASLPKHRPECLIGLTLSSPKPDSLSRSVRTLDGLTLQAWRLQSSEKQRRPARLWERAGLHGNRKCTWVLEEEAGASGPAWPRAGAPSDPHLCTAG